MGRQLSVSFRRMEGFVFNLSQTVCYREDGKFLRLLDKDNTAFLNQQIILGNFKQIIFKYLIFCFLNTKGIIRIYAF